MEKPVIEFETERLMVRFLRVEDKEEYLSLKIQTIERPRIYDKLQGFAESEWEIEWMRS